MSKATTTTTTTTTYSSQAEAEREARAAIWGEVTFARRESVLPEPGTYSTVVSSTVNGHLVALFFDNYGRRTDKPKVLR